MAFDVIYWKWSFIGLSQSSFKTGIRKIAEIHKGDFRLTANQNLIVAYVDEQDKDEIERITREHGLINDKVTPQRENSMSCVAFPTCPLAMAESEPILATICG